MLSLKERIKLTLIILIFFLIGNAFVTVFALEGPNYVSNMTDGELVREYQKSYLGEHPMCRKYLYDVLYVRMSEEEFIGKFTKDVSCEGFAKPYIFKKTKNVYYITFPNLPYLRDNMNLIRRITFNDGFLIKMENRYLSKPPFMWYVYEDITYVLKGFTDGLGFYKGMSEEEFSNVFSGRILRHSMNQYIFIANDRNKYQVNFEDGKLYGVSRY